MTIDELTEKVESIVGMGRGAWDTIDAREIVRATLEASNHKDARDALDESIKYCERIIVAEMGACHESLIALIGLDPFKESLRKSEVVQ